MREDPCRLYEPALAALDELDGLRLDPDEVEAARAHLAGCPRCQARRRMWARLDEALRNALAPSAATPTLMTADLLATIGADHEPNERRTPMLSVVYMRDEDIMDDQNTRGTPAPEAGQAANGTSGTDTAGAPERHFAPLPSLATAQRQSGWRRAMTGIVAVVAVAALVAGITGAMSLTGRLSGTQNANHARATAAAATQTAQVGPFVSQQPQIAGIAFNSSADGWVVMQNVSNNSSNSWLYHYANGTYTQTATPANWSAFNAKLWPFAPNNLWVFAGAGVYHYDGANWTQQTFPTPPNTQGISALSAVTMVSPTQGWAVGNTFIGPVGAQKLIQAFYHYDGSVWRIDPADSQASDAGYTTQIDQTNPNGYSTNQIQLTGFSATPDGDVWASGYILYQNQSSCCVSDATGYLYHRVNGVWRLAQVMPHYELDAIQMTGPRSGWLTGKKYETHKITSTVPMTISGETPVVFSWDGARWSPAAFPQPDSTQAGMTLTQIAAASPSNVWIIGSSSATTLNAGPYASDNTYLIHFDGARWSRVSLPQIAAINPSHDLSIQNQVTFGNIALTPSGDLWIAGALIVQGNGSYQSAPLLYRYSGGQWTNVPLPAIKSTSGSSTSGSQPAG